MPPRHRIPPRPALSSEDLIQNSPIYPTVIEK